MAQLHKDIATSFANARRTIEAYASVGEDLSVDLRRWTDHAMRFIEPDITIDTLHRIVLEKTDDLVGLMTDQPRQRPSTIMTAKTHLTEAFDDLEDAILKRGILTARGEKVGLGIAGRPI